MTANDYLLHLVVAKTAQGEIQGVGVCISYCDAPMVGIRKVDGSQFHWRADLCDILPVDEKIAALLLVTKETANDH